MGINTQITEYAHKTDCIFQVRQDPTSGQIETYIGGRIVKGLQEPSPTEFNSVVNCLKKMQICMGFEVEQGDMWTKRGEKQEKQHTRSKGCDIGLSTILYSKRRAMCPSCHRYVI